METGPGKEDSIVPLSLADVRAAEKILRAVNNPLRQSILKLLENEQRTYVKDIYLKLHVLQSIASLHLAILRRSHLVCTERQGQLIYYTINTARIEEIAAFADKMSGISE